MRIYITGATGFVGSRVVSEAVGRGHDVVAVVRPTSTATFDTTGEGAGSIAEARVDLRSRHGLDELLDDVDVVIHLAAAKSGNIYTQFAGTVMATENLLSAMEEAKVQNLVGISTFSVYDYMNIKPGTLIDEGSPIDRRPARRDEYARTKLVQEDLYREFGSVGGHRQVIIRPGMVYGPGNLWHALLGADFGSRFLRIGSKAILPIVYVENCADAIVSAAEELVAPDSALDGRVINIVDDDLPTQRQYAELVAARMDTPPTVPIPWPALRTAAGLLQRANDAALGGRAVFPGIAVPERLHARFKPLRYTNRLAKELLGWTPRYDLASAIDRSIQLQNAVDPPASDPSSTPESESSR